jgi:arylsulfatase A-like enzyme
MKIPSLLLCALTLQAAVVQSTHAQPATAKRPNVLFLITDDQFKDMMNFLPEGQGKNLTPNTDRLASGATVMTRQYVTSPVCTPSRYGCLTGRYPSRSRAKEFIRGTEKTGGQTVVQWNTFITSEKTTMPLKFREAGYVTGIVGKNHVVDVEGWVKPQWTADPYAAETKELLAANAKAQAEAAKAIGFDYAASLYYNNPNENGVKALASHNLDWIAKGALDFLDHAGDKPFFLYLATTIPHGPQEPGRSWDADRRITAEGMLDKPLEILPPRATIPQRLAAAKLGGKQRENVLWLDDMFGAVIKKLEENGQLDNTIIVYFNDNGQRSKGTVYEGGVHTESFFWRKGGFPAGGICEVPVSNVDFAPTLLDLAGVNYDETEFDGKSFAQVLLGQKAERRDSLYFELGYVRGVRMGDWKYIALRYPESARNMTRDERQAALDEFNAEQQKKGRPIYTRDPMQPFSHILLIPGGGDAEHLSMDKYPAFYDADQLYNLKEDPDEQKNLAADPAHAATLAKMKEELKKHLATLPGTFGELKM